MGSWAVTAILTRSDGVFLSSSLRADDGSYLRSLGRTEFREIDFKLYTEISSPLFLKKSVKRKGQNQALDIVKLRSQYWLLKFSRVANDFQSPEIRSFSITMLLTFELSMPSPGSIFTVSGVTFGASILSCLSRVVTVVCTPHSASFRSTGHCVVINLLVDSFSAKPISARI
jgi:hypothetical protein